MEIELAGNEMYYGKTGSGKKTLLLFHGFGQDHRVFDDLTRSISADYTCYSFDLFFHGNSRQSKNAKPITSADWKNLLSTFLSAEKIEEFSLLGFSIGARLVLATIELFSNRIERVYLIAPDGIKNNFWFTVATQYGPTRMLFRKTITSPGLLTGVMGITGTLRLMHPSLLRFARNQMKTQEQREKIYNTWMMFSKLTMNLPGIVSKINDSQIAVTLILGKHDRLIPQRENLLFIRSIETGKVIQLESTHGGLISALSSKASDIFTASDEIQR